MFVSQMKMERQGDSYNIIPNENSNIKSKNLKHFYKLNKNLVKFSTVNKVVPYTVICIIMKHYDRAKVRR